MIKSDQQSIRTELQRVIDARSFKASERLRRLLRHLVEKRLDDRQDELTQRHLAEAIFERGPDFDPENDAIVRVEMRKLRNALDAFYSASNAECSIKITIPPGSYVPVFEGNLPTEKQHKQRSVTAAKGDTKVAVLPFVIGDAGSGLCSLLAEGIVDELQTLLQRITGVQLLPTWQLEGPAQRSRTFDAMFAERGVRFVLNGSARCSKKSIRISARLHDIADQTQLWSHRYETVIDTTALLDTQEEIARHIALNAIDRFTGVMGIVLRRESNQAIALDSRSEDVAISRYYEYVHTLSDTSYRAATEAMGLVTTVIGRTAAIRAMAADLRRAGYSLGFTDDDNPIDSVIDELRQSLNDEPSCLQARVSMCYALLQKRDLRGLHEQIDIVLNNPTSPDSIHADVALPLALSGEWERGCAILERVINSTDFYPQFFQIPFFLRAYKSGDYQHANQLANDFRNSSLFLLSLFRAAVLGKLHRPDEASVHIERLVLQRPKISNLARRYLACFILEDLLVDELLEGLNLAGLKTS